MTPSQVFNAFSPELAFVESEFWAGSAILLEDGHLLTNAHVLTPSTAAERVVFPDGQEFFDVPVVAWDWVLDIALLGPVERDGGLLIPAEEQTLEIGTEVFLIGYPGEVDSSPQPSITRGILSRVRESETGGVRYLQTDAAIAGGQSGGLLASELGEVLGLSGFAFTEAGFGMALASDDLRNAIDSMLEPSGDDYRPVVVGQTSKSWTPELEGYFDQKAFALKVPAEGISFVADAYAYSDLVLTLADYFGGFDSADDYIEGGTEQVEIELFGPNYLFLIVEQFDVTTEEIVLETSWPVSLIEENEPDTIQTDGKVARGAFDFVGDYDAYKIDLNEGQSLTAHATSLLADVVLGLWFGTDPDPVGEDDDSGGGIWGTDAKMAVTAPASGTYILTVSDALLGGAKQGTS